MAFWWSIKITHSPVREQHDFLLASEFSRSAGLLAERLLRTDDNVGGFAAVHTASAWALLWGRHGLPVLQEFDPDFAPSSDLRPLESPGAYGGTIAGAVATGDGFAILFAGSDQPLPDSSSGLFLSFVDTQGIPLRAPVLVHETTFGSQSDGDLAAGSDGLLSVVYQDFPGDQNNPPPSISTDVRLRRFSPGGEALGPSVVVNTHREGNQGAATIAGSPAGRLVVAWASSEQDGSSSGIYAQRFDASGSRRGSEFRVNQVTISSQTQPSVAVDSQGNFLVAWESFNPDPFDDEAWQIKARLFRANGKPVGPEITVNQHSDSYQQFAHVAFMGEGQFLVGWNSYAQVSPTSSSQQDVFVRRFSASKGDEPCLVSQGLLRCDTGRTGGELEVVHPFGVSSDGPTMLGDIDGDGRADPCEWANNRFRCDTDHEGGVAEVKLLLSGAGMPLVGDVDGDGRADPCLYTTGRFSCDTAHNGGKGETVLLFGKPGQTPLLGDLDGDGRDDACTFANGVFRCETKNNGGQPEVVIAFGQGDDQPLLGDFDGDGDDDPCVHRAGVLMCDTAHDGGAAEATLSLGLPGDRLVLGNLDGL